MATTSSGGEPDHATADREIVISRVIGAPRELVFEAFTQVRHLSRWWGPEGFTTTTRSFEFRVGGAWDFVMHGPDGTDYQEWITWTEIVPPERIALLHGESRDDPNAFESVLAFEPAGEETRIVMRTVFPTKELRDEAVEKYHAIEGGEQTLRNLAAYVAELTGNETAERAHTEGSGGLMAGKVFFMSCRDPRAGAGAGSSPDLGRQVTTVLAMVRVLVTGMSGAGKTTVLDELRRRGHMTVDADYDSWELPDGTWDEQRVRQLLASNPDVIVSGTADNQRLFYDHFEHVVLLSAPLDVLLERVSTRTNNPYGRTPDQQAQIARYVDTVEPLLRRGATLEFDGRRPAPELADVIEDLLTRTP